VRFTRNAKIFKGQLEVAPFAGVFFLLVLFLLLNSSLVFVPSLRLDLPLKMTLPTVAGPELAGTEGSHLVVVVDLRGQLYFNQRVVQEGELRSQLIRAARTMPQATLVVEADRDARLETVVQLCKMAGDAGIRRVDMAIRPPVFPATETTTTVP
jgi:biopolymer transport protein ExbD